MLDNAPFVVEWNNLNAPNSDTSTIYNINANVIGDARIFQFGNDPGPTSPSWPNLNISGEYKTLGNFPVIEHFGRTADNPNLTISNTRFTTPYDTTIVSANAWEIKVAGAFDINNSPELDPNITFTRLYEYDAPSGGGVSQSQLDDSTAAIRTDFPDITGLVNQAQLDDSTAAIRGDFPIADGTETIINQGANISITGNGSSATPYVITGTGGGGGGGAKLAQVHPDSLGAIPGDGLDDSAAFQASFDTLKNNPAYTTWICTAGGEYNIKHVDVDLLSSSDTAFIDINFNGARITIDTQLTHEGNFTFEGSRRIKIRNGNFIGKGYGDLPYNEKNTMLYFHNAENIQVYGNHFIAPYSHAIRGGNAVLTTGTEKRGHDIWGNYFLGHKKNIRRYDSRFSYIKFEYRDIGAGEYNNVHDNEVNSGQSFIRMLGSANNSIYANNILDMGVWGPGWNADSIFQQAIIYGDTTSNSTNHGKNDVWGNTINHNDTIVVVAFKGNKGNYLNPDRVHHNNFLVNGRDIVLGEIAYFENAGRTQFTNNFVRGRQKPNSAYIYLVDSDSVLIAHNLIDKTSGGAHGVRATDSDKVILESNDFNGNPVIDDSTSNSTFIFRGGGVPTYPDIGTALLDTTLAEGSQFRVEGQTTVQIVDRNATYADYDLPYLRIEDSTYVQGFPVTSAQFLVQFDQNAITEAKWRLSDEYKIKMRFRLDSILNLNHLYQQTGTNSLFLKYRKATTEIEVTYNNGSTTTSTNTISTPLDTAIWYDLEMEYTIDDSVKVWIDDVLEFADLAPNVNFSSFTNNIRLGSAINTNVGIKAAIGYFQHTPITSNPLAETIARKRYEFGDNDPQLEAGGDFYTLAGDAVKTGNDYIPVSMEFPGAVITKQEDHIVVDFTAVKRGIYDGQGRIQDFGTWTEFTQPTNLITANGSGDVRKTPTNQAFLILATETSGSGTATIGTELPVNSTGGPITITPPGSPVAGQIFAVFDSRGQAATNNITIDTSGDLLNGSAIDYVISTTRGYVEFRYINATIGWRQKD